MDLSTSPTSPSSPLNGATSPGGPRAVATTTSSSIAQPTSPVPRKPHKNATALAAASATISGLGTGGSGIGPAASGLSSPTSAAAMGSPHAINASPRSSAGTGSKPNTAASSGSTNTSTSLDKYPLMTPDISEIIKNSPSLQKLIQLKEEMLKVEYDEKHPSTGGQGTASSAFGASRVSRLSATVGGGPPTAGFLLGSPSATMTSSSTASTMRRTRSSDAHRWNPSLVPFERRGSNFFEGSKRSAGPIAFSSTLSSSDVPMTLREREKLEQENQMLHDIILLRQDVSLRREQQCQQELLELKQRLDRSVTLPYVNLPSLMGELRSVNEQIQNEIAELKGSIESHAEVEKMNLIRTYRVKIHELKNLLDEEKQINYRGAQEWIEKNKALENDLNVAVHDMTNLREKNRSLDVDNRNLKLDFQAQERDRQQQIHEIAIVRKENERLTAQIEQLQYQAVQLARKRIPMMIYGGTSTSPTMVASRANFAVSAVASQRNTSPRAHASVSPRTIAVGTTSNAQGNSAGSSSISGGGGAPTTQDQVYLDAIAKLRNTLDQERRYLRHARTQHMALLAERTELEIFLRQCVDDVRKEIARNSKTLQQQQQQPLLTQQKDSSSVTSLDKDLSGGKSGSAAGATTAAGASSSRPTSEGSARDPESVFDQYAANDRKKILDILLSKERVLTLLYERMFPHKQPSGVERQLELDRVGNMLQKAVTSESGAVGLDISGATNSAETVGADIDMSHLWSKWKKWTSAHNIRGSGYPTSAT